MITIITYPLITGIILSIYGNKIGKKGVEIVTKINIIALIIIISKYIIENIRYNNIRLLNIDWINIGIYNIKYNIIIDRYTILMIILIITISSIVILYSFWYMEEDNNKNRFIIYLLFFTVSMLILIITYNYLLMFIGWEFVGLISFLLINYWYINYNNNKSAFKALILNKIGDIFFIIFIALYIINNTNVNIMNQSFNYSTYSLYFLFLAAIAKSAQLFFHVWLGDAMAGPTPVSALLHAATMVTAGIYILIRYNIINTNNYIIYIAILTIILGGLAAINQYDMKKIIAYSTVSQLGYMLYSIGINNKELAIYHLLTHGFFKALLFLTAGIIIHNYYNEQDIRKLGNLIYNNPLSYIFFLYGTLSIISFPYFSGYYSKELIIYNSYYNNIFILSLLYIGVLFTIIYSYNLIYNIFLKHNKILPIKEHIPYYFYLLFFPLLLGSLLVGYYLYDYIIMENIIHINILDYIPTLLHIIPSILIIITIYSISIINNNYPYIYSSLLHIILNRRVFIDSIYNNISYYLLYYSYLYLYKYIDRGILELTGPIGLYRLLLIPPTPIPNRTKTSILLIIFIIFLFLILYIYIFIPNTFTFIPPIPPIIIERNIIWFNDTYKDIDLTPFLDYYFK